MSLTEARVALSQIIDGVTMGETIIITKHRVPVAQVTPIGTQPAMNWSRDDVSESIAAWRKYRKEHNITLGDDLSIMDLIREGRRG